MAITDSWLTQQPSPSSAPDHPVDFDFSQFAHYQQPFVNPLPTLGELLVGAALLGLGGYALYKFCEPAPRRGRCSACGSKCHNVARCPHVGERQHFSWNFEKTGWCECCGYDFPKTHLHHYGGRTDNGKAKEMCGACHLQCGHSGHWGNFAINPRYCRVAA
jgi:hypothetical protein